MKLKVKQFLTWNSLFLFVVLSIFQFSCNESEPKEIAEFIYHNGSIITMSGKSPEYVEAVATIGKEIVALGKFDEVKKLESDSTVLVDLNGTTLLPGFIDSHLHPMLATILIQTNIIAFNDWKLPHGFFKGVRDGDSYLKKLRSAVANHKPKDEPFISWGYHHLFHGEVDKDILDKLFPDVPVIIWQYSFHEVRMNSAAIELLDIDYKAAMLHHQVDMMRGRFYETGMAEMVAPKLLPYILSPKGAAEGMILTAKAIQNGGVTTVGDMAMPLIDFDLELRLLKGILDNETIPFRTYLIPNARLFANSSEKLQAAFSIIDSLDVYNSEKVQFVKQVKLLADGAFYAQLMQMKEPYLDGHEGEWLTEPEELEKYADFFWKRDYRIHVHANGDKGVEKTLETLEKLQRDNPKEDHRFTFHHLGYTDKDQVQRMATLGAHASIQPYYVYALSSKYSETGLGKERAQNISPVGYLIDNDIVTCFHSDFFMAPADPLTLMWVAVNRKSIDGKTFGRELRVSPWEALKAVTINGAFHLNQEHHIGSIEIGKKADFVILDKDPLKVDAEDIGDIKVLKTVYEGRAFPQ
ncbi:MAG: amidohydrolase [Saprospiraceae bacterium]|nr:amidohydrolase [Saprospiraceae bacterium]